MREKLGKDYSVKFERNVADELKRVSENNYEANFDNVDLSNSEKKELKKRINEEINPLKHEIDIVITNNKSMEKYAVELKFPRNGQYPEQMFSFVKDVYFMEKMKENGFTGTFCLTVVDDNKYYSGLKEDNAKIYTYFRDVKEGKVFGSIEKPTGKYKYNVIIKHKQQFTWNPIPNASKNYCYYLICIK